MPFTWTPARFYLIQNGLTCLSVLGLLRIIFPKVAPLRLLVDGARTAVNTRAGRYGVVALIVTGAVNYVMNSVDPWFTQLAVRLHGVADFAVYIYAIEGGLTAHLQAWAPPALIAFFLYVYVSLFPALYGATLLGLFHLRRYPLVRAGTVALILNWVLALPFFLFVSVRETWYSAAGNGLPKARLLLDDLSRDLEPIFRTERGIENNFPSLHTAVAVTAVLLAWHSGNVRLTAVCAIAAALIAFSTLYLGFHWVTDMLGGIAHAALCTTLAVRWVGIEVAPTHRRGAVIAG